jgi:hypothetical protein
MSAGRGRPWRLAAFLFACDLYPEPVRSQAHRAVLVVRIVTGKTSRLPGRTIRAEPHPPSSAGFRCLCLNGYVRG